MIKQLIPEIEEALDYLSKIAPGLARYAIVIDEETYETQQAYELPSIIVNRLAPQSFGISVRLRDYSDSQGDETQYYRFIHSAICNDFILEKGTNGIVYALSSKLLSADDTYNTICRILYHFGYNPSVKLHILRLIDKSPDQPVCSSDGAASFSSSFVSQNSYAFPILSDAINDAIKIIQNINSDSYYLYIALGTAENAEKIIFFIDEEHITFNDESYKGYHSPDKLNKYISFRHNNLLSINPYSVSLSLPLKNQTYTLHIITDLISYLHPDLTPENLVAIIKPLVFEPEFAPDLLYFPDGTKPSPEQLVDARARILHQIELDNQNNIP